LKRIIVAIDGPAGSGKSTVSKLVARELGYTYIDTGAMYRAVGLAAKRAGVALKASPEMDALLRDIDIELIPSGGGNRVLLDGEDVSENIRTPEASMAASKVSAIGAVRDRLLGLQRDMGKSGGVVMDGRDIGTVIFPEAQAKFFVTADVEERARRRQAELEQNGDAPDFSATLSDMKNRDEDDSGRDIAPLRKAEDALLVDTTGMAIDEAVARIAARVTELAGA
jgi:cytidylate kinase